MYFYRSDFWCDECGKLILEALVEKGGAIDTGHFPQGPYPADVEVDIPRHCAAGENCVHAIELPSGRRIGALLSTTLSDEGIELVKLAVRHNREISDFWEQAFEHQLVALRSLN